MSIIGLRRRLREEGGVVSFTPMRLFRALAHLVLALALIGAAFAPARAIASAPAQADQGHGHARPAGVSAEHAAHDQGAPASEHPAHKRDGCQTACCFIPSQPPPRAPDATAVEFFCAVRYTDAEQPASGRTDAPDPEIPKAAA